MLDSPLQPNGHGRQILMRMLSLARKLGEYVNWIVYRDTHYLWLMDSLRAQKVIILFRDDFLLEDGRKNI